MAVGENIKYNINFNNDTVEFQGAGLIVLTETNIGYDVTFNFTVLQKQPPFAVVAKFNSEEEDLEFETSGFPDDIVNQYFEDIVFDIIDSPKFDSIRVLGLTEDRFSYEAQNPPPTPVDESENTPTYQVAADKSEVKGTITFEEDSEFGYLGKITLTNFPEGYVISYALTTSPIVEANYETLKVEALKVGQEYLDTLKKDTVDFGTLKIVSFVDESATQSIKYKTKGTVVDNEDNPITGATIKDTLGNNTTSETTGDFTLLGDYISGSLFDINISAKGYGQATKKPFNQDGTIKNNLGIIKLQSTQVDLKDAIDAELPLPDLQVEAMKLPKINFEMAQQQAMNQVITTVKTVLLPAVLAQLAAFGIAKASEALNKKFGDLNVTCPTNLDELNRLIEKKNRLVKALNNIYNFLNGVKVGVQILDTTLTAAQIALEVLKALTLIPSTSVTPIPGSSATGVEKIERELKKYKLISSVTLMVLVILIQILERILALLALLDQVIGKCAIEGALPQEKLTDDLLLSTQFQSNQLSPVITNINGFEMDVIAVDGETDNELKQRRAVARNAQGVIMLQGEPSYSSNDQILIDELVFYIQQNDLKAD
jgi:hypothetical protein